MRRREFLSLAGAAATWPIAVSAQQSKPLIGFLRTTDASSSAHLVTALHRGLTEVGIVEGKNVDIVYSYAEGNRNRLKDLATELIRRNVTVIVANTAAARIAKTSTSTVPIVFVTGTDPVQTGLVSSFNRPGGNVTGIYFANSELTDKRLGLLRELIPNSKVIALLSDVNGPGHEKEVSEVTNASHNIGQKVVVVKCTTADKLPEAFVTATQSHADALLIGAGPFFLSQRKLLVTLAARHAIPALFVTRQYPDAGGLISYGPSQTDAYRQAGVYAGQIIKGSAPSEIPVVQSAKFELVINMKTAKTLGFTAPDKFIALADELIE